MSQKRTGWFNPVGYSVSSLLCVLPFSSRLSKPNFFRDTSLLAERDQTGPGRSKIVTCGVLGPLGSQDPSGPTSGM